MNANFEQWLEEQTYTLANGGIFSYRWSELICFANYNNELATIDKNGYVRRSCTWGLWREIRTNDNAGGPNQEDQT